MAQWLDSYSATSGDELSSQEPDIDSTETLCPEAQSCSIRFWLPGSREHPAGCIMPCWSADPALRLANASSLQPALSGELGWLMRWKNQVVSLATCESPASFCYPSYDFSFVFFVAQPLFGFTSINYNQCHHAWFSFLNLHHQRT